MRKLKRAVARYRMKKAGITRMNKTRYDIKGNRYPSYFAENWRKVFEGKGAKKRMGKRRKAVKADVH